MLSIEENKLYKESKKAELVKQKQQDKLSKVKPKPKTKSKTVATKPTKASGPKVKKGFRVDNILPRYLDGEKILKKEQDWLQKRLVDEADKYFATFIRNRDKDKDCITGALETCQHRIMNCCHWISRGYYSHRWDEQNCAGGCVSCNKHYAQDHGAMFENVQIKRYGIEWVDKQRFNKNKIKPTINELVEIINKYK